VVRGAYYMMERVPRIQRVKRNGPGRPSKLEQIPPPDASAVKKLRQHRLLVKRKDARTYLGDPSIPTLRQWERSGLLTPIRHSPNKVRGEVYYATSEILALFERLYAEARAAAE
jgi:hypothetical protein